MKKTIVLLLIILVIPTVAATVFRMNANIDKDDIVELFDNENISMAKGRINTYMTTRRGFQTSGSIRTTVFGDNGRQVIGVKWRSRGSRYFANLTIDEDDIAVIEADARVSINGQREYGVPITITYYKDAEEMDVEGDDFSFIGIEATETCVQFANQKFCR